MSFQIFTVPKGLDGELRVRDLVLGGQRVCTQVSGGASQRGPKCATNGQSLLVLSENTQHDHDDKST